MSDQGDTSVGAEVGGFALCNDKRDTKDRWAQQDRWCVARLSGGGAVCAVADGMSQWDWSSAIAELACESFLDRFIELHTDEPGLDGFELVSRAFAHAVDRCYRERQRAGDTGGAAFVAAYMTPEGRVWTAQAGDTRIWGRKKGMWQPLTTEGHTGPSGGLTLYLGKPPERFENIEDYVPRNVHSDVDMIVAASDGFYEPLINLGTLETELEARVGGLPTEIAHELVRFAVSLSSRDNISMAIISRRVSEGAKAAPATGRRTDLSWPVLASTALVFAVAGMLGGFLLQGSGLLPPPPTPRGAAKAPAPAKKTTASPETKEDKGPDTLKGLQARVEKACGEALGDVLEEKGSRFGLAFVTEHVKAQVPAMDKGTPFDAETLRVGFEALHKACPDLGDDCVGEEAGWWMIKVDGEALTWEQGLACLGRRSVRELSVKAPLVMCEVKGKALRCRASAQKK